MTPAIGACILWFFAVSVWEPVPFHIDDAPYRAVGWLGL